MLVCSVGRYQLPGIYGFFQGKKEGGFSSGAEPDEHIRDEGSSHTPGAEFCGTQDAVSFEDNSGFDFGSLAEIVINSSHAPALFQDDEGLVLEGFEGNDWIWQGLHPMVLANHGVVAGHCHKHSFLHNRHSMESFWKRIVEQGKVHMALKHMLLKPGCRTFYYGKADVWVALVEGNHGIC